MTGVCIHVNTVSDYNLQRLIATEAEARVKVDVDLTLGVCVVILCDGFVITK